MGLASVVGALVMVGMAVAGFRAYGKVLVLMDRIETRQVAPAMARINAILYDVNTVTRKVEQETERIDHAIHTTMDRFDHTADSYARTCGPRPARWSASSAACAWQSHGCGTLGMKRSKLKLGGGDNDRSF
jgi:hypothetical protein